MEVHQVLVGASPGDAITNAALDLRDVLRGVCPSDVYARFYDARLENEVLPLRDLARRPASHPEDNLILFHASIGEPEVFNFIQERPERLVVIHHNISPPAPFMAYDPVFAGRLEGGRRELASLSRKAILALADSAFNAQDLRSLGYRNVKVSPLLLDLDRLSAIEPHALTVNHFDKLVKGPLVVFVGQQLPHKRPDFVLQAFYALSTYLDPDAHLVLVGAPRLPRYTSALEMLLHELHLPRAWIAGRVSDEELVAYYRRADLFVTASEHEGFCAPLLEAMTFDVPVLARSFAAVPETARDAAVLLDPDDGPLVMAEAMHELLHSDAVRAELVERGRRRLEDFSPAAARATMLGHLMDLF